MRYWQRRPAIDRSPTTRFLVRWLLYPLQALLIDLSLRNPVLPLRWGTSIVVFCFERSVNGCGRPRGGTERSTSFPELTDREVEALLENIWDNLGRGACEFAHMDRFWTAPILELKLSVVSI